MENAKQSIVFALGAARWLSGFSSDVSHFTTFRSASKNGINMAFFFKRANVHSTTNLFRERKKETHEETP